MSGKVLIIAEAGVNYNGDIGLAKKMVKAAADAGADYVKFQTGVPKLDVSVFAEKAAYQKVNTGDAQGNESQLEMCSKLMLPFDVYPELIRCCEENHIRFNMFNDMKKIVILTLVCMMLSLASFAQTNKRPDSYNYNRAVEAIQKNNVEEALDYLKKEISDN